MRFYFDNKLINKHSNYNSYATNRDVKAISEEVLVNVIEKLMSKYGNPYIRFMWLSGIDDAHCVIYNNKEKVTRVIPFKTLEDL